MKKMTMKELRLAKKLSQAAFAATIGVSGKSIGAYETGRTNPSEKVQETIREVYGVEIKPEKAETKKAEPKKATAKKAGVETEVIIQSPLGGVITPAEIVAKTGPVEKVYVRVDENKAYWVSGEESGSVDLW